MTRLTRYEPISVLTDLAKLFDSDLYPFIRKDDPSNIETSQWRPAVDIKEEKNRFVILADLPGIDKNDLHVAMEDNVLTIKGERHSENKEEGEGYSRLERISGSFHRRFTLPETADGDNITANMRKGVLEISVPKREVAKSKIIEILEHD